MQIAVVPTIFVALGGTGQIILHRLRERLVQRVGTADIPFFRFLYLDTDQGSANGAVAGLTGKAAEWSVANVMSPSPDTIVKVQNPQLDNGRVAKALDIDSWFDENARTQLGTVNYAQGVGGRRMFSRLGFLASQNLGPLEQTLIAFYDGLITSGSLVGRPLDGIEPPYLNVKPAKVEEGVRFVVVTSAGGGTGSGCFIDFGFLLRKLRREHSWDQVYQFGSVALARPGVETQNQQRNTAALLTEMDHYCDRDQPNIYQANYLTLTGSPSFTDRNPPYDATYVVSATQQHVPLAGDKVAAFDQLLWRMAEYLLTDAVGVFHDSVPSQEVKLPRSGPVGAIAFLGDIGLNPSGVQTYGVSCREWPAAQVHRELYSKVIQRCARAWAEPQVERVQEVVEALRRRLGIADEAAQRNDEPRNVDADALAKTLLQPVNDLDPFKQLRRISEDAYNERGMLAEGHLAQVLNRVRQQFQPRTGPPSGDQPGITYAIIQSNLAALTNESERASLPRAVAEELLRLCVDGRGGPASAARSASDLRAAVQREARFVGECLTGLNPVAPESALTLEQCWRYANDAMLQQVLQAKQQFYRQMERWLDQLSRRLVHFTAYIQEWARSVSQDDAASASRSPSLVVPPAIKQQLEEAVDAHIVVDLSSLEQEREDHLGQRRLDLMSELGALIAAGMPERDERGQPTLFAEGPPKEHGATDFSYLRRVEQAVFQSIAQSEASPYNVQILSILQQEASRTSTPMPSLIGEAELLVNYDAGATGYSTLPFGGNPTHISKIVQLDQAGYPAFETAQAGGRGWVSRWQGVGQIKEISVYHQVTRSLNPQTVAYVSERCSIRTPFISGYSHDQRRTLFAVDPFPAMSDRRIKLPPDATALRRAEMLLLGSIVLNQWVYLGGTQPYHELAHTVQNPETGFPLTRMWRAARDFMIAARTLADAPEVMNAIDRKVQVYVHDNGGAAATAVNEACQRINDQAQTQPRRDHGSLLQWNLDNVPYDPALDWLIHFALQFGIRLPVVPHSYAQPLKAGDPRANTEVAPQDGWYCTRCGHSFGVNMPLRTGDGARCPVETCNNPYAPLRGTGGGHE